MMFVKIPSIKENVSVVESFIENVGEKIRIEEELKAIKQSKIWKFFSQFF